MALVHRSVMPLRHTPSLLLSTHNMDAREKAAEALYIAKMEQVQKQQYQASHHTDDKDAEKLKVILALPQDQVINALLEWKKQA